MLQLNRKLEPGERIPIKCVECPSCKWPVRIDKQFYVCDNEECHDKVVNKIVSALDDLGSKGISTSIVADMVNLGAKNVFDVMMFDVNKFSGMEGYGDRKIKNIGDELERLKNSRPKPEAILAALNIPGFGKSMFKKLLKDVKYIDFVHLHDFTHLPNMSDIRSKQLNEGLNKQETWDLHRELTRHWNYVYTDLFPEKPLPVTKEAKKSFRENMNMKVCFTGAGNKTREEYSELAEGAGMEVVGSVSKGVNLLVCFDPNSNSGKMKKARDLGTKVISYEEFESIVS